MSIAYLKRVISCVVIVSVLLCSFGEMSLADSSDGNVILNTDFFGIGTGISDGENCKCFDSDNGYIYSTDWNEQFQDGSGFYRVYATFASESSVPVSLYVDASSEDYACTGLYFKGLSSSENVFEEQCIGILNVNTDADKLFVYRRGGGNFKLRQLRFVKCEDGGYAYYPLNNSTTNATDTTTAVSSSSYVALNNTSQAELNEIVDITEGLYSVILDQSCVTRHSMYVKFTNTATNASYTLGSIGWDANTYPYAPTADNADYTHNNPAIGFAESEVAGVGAVSNTVNLPTGKYKIKIDCRAAGGKAVYSRYMILNNKSYTPPVPEKGIILDENNSNNNPEKGYTDNSIASYYTTKVNNLAACNEEFLKVEGGERFSISYFPKLENEKYEVFINRPDLNNTYTADMRAEIVFANGTRTVNYSLRTGSGKTGYYSLGVYEFSGTSMDRIILYNQENDDEDVVLYFDSVKFEKIEALEEEVNELIIDETNRTALNPNYTAVVPSESEFALAEKYGFGYVLYDGIDYGAYMRKLISYKLGANPLLESRYSGAVNFEFSVSYYPRLENDYYQVFINRPNLVENTKIKTEVHHMFGTDNPDFNINTGNTGWYPIGIYKFNGIYGEDVVKLNFEKPSNYAEAIVDGVKFVKYNMPELSLDVSYPDITTTVSKSSSFRLKSSAKLNSQTVSSDTIKIVESSTGEEALCDVAVSADGMQVTINPISDLKPETYYKIVANDVFDVYDRQIVTFSRAFYSDFDVDGPTASVELGTDEKFLVSFCDNEVNNIDDVSSYRLYENNNALAFEVEKVSDNAVKIVPKFGLRDNTNYRVELTCCLMDYDGNPISGKTLYSFKTGTVKTTAKDLQYSMTYPDFTFNVNPNGRFEISFNQPLDKKYISDKYFKLLDSNGVELPISVSADEQFKIVTIVPDKGLLADSVYRIWISDFVKSDTGNCINDNYGISFRTRIAQGIGSDIKPRLSVEGQTVSDNGQVLLMFSDDIDLQTLKCDSISVKSENNVADVSINVLDTRQLLITPVSGFLSNVKYDVKVSPDVKSLYGFAVEDAEMQFNTYNAEVINITDSSAGGNLSVSADFNVYNSDGYSVMVVSYEDGIVKNIEITDRLTSISIDKAFSGNMSGKWFVFADADNLYPALGSNGSDNKIILTEKINNGNIISFRGSVVGDNRPKEVYYAVTKNVFESFDNAEDVIYIDSVNTDINGNFEINYVIPNSVLAGTYNLLIGATGVKTMQKYIVSMASEYSEYKLSAALKDAFESSDIEKLDSIIINNGAIFNLSNEFSVLFSKVDKTKRLDCLKGTANEVELLDNIALLALTEFRQADLEKVYADVVRILLKDESFVSDVKYPKTAVALIKNNLNISKENIKKYVAVSLAISLMKNQNVGLYPDIINKYSAYLEVDLNGVLNNNNFFDALSESMPQFTVIGFKEKFNEIKGNYLNNELAGGSPSHGGGGGSISIPSSVPISVIADNNDMNIFKDIDSVEWAKTAIYELNRRSIVNGVDGNSFMPNDMVTREQFVKMLVLALNLNLSNNVQFSDCSEKDWYYPYVAAGTANGIVNGISESYFGTGRFITRQDMAVMLYRAGKLCGVDFDSDVRGEFVDSNEISVYAAEAVNKIVSKGIMNGVGNGMFLPGDNATRAMAAKVIYEFMKIL